MMLVYISILVCHVSLLSLLLCSSILHFAEQSVDPEIRVSTFSPRLMEVQDKLFIYFNRMISHPY